MRVSTSVAGCECSHSSTHGRPAPVDVDARARQNDARDVRESDPTPMSGETSAARLWLLGRGPVHVRAAQTCAPRMAWAGAAVACGWRR